MELGLLFLACKNGVGNVLAVHLVSNEVGYARILQFMAINERDYRNET